MQKLFAPSLLRALVSRNVLVSVLALVVDDMNVADNDGRIIAPAQEQTSDTLEPDLVAYAKAQAQSNWVLFDEPQGLVIKAIYVIRNADSDPIGMMEVGNVLTSKFLQDIKIRSTADLALIWNGQVRASTVEFSANTDFPTTGQVDALPNDVLIRNLTANNTNSTV